MKNIQATRGFTLIELLIAVSIILILGAIAIPNYRNHVLRANRSDAMATLLQVAAAQEKFYMQNNTYSGDLTATGLNVGTTSTNGHYSITIQGANADGFSAIATPNPSGPGNQAHDKQCTQFSIDQQGTKTATGTNAAKCWR